jgi:hypothetical protein
VVEPRPSTGGGVGRSSMAGNGGGAASFIGVPGT